MIIRNEYTNFNKRVGVFYETDPHWQFKQIHLVNEAIRILRQCQYTEQGKVLKQNEEQ